VNVGTSRLILMVQMPSGVRELEVAQVDGKESISKLYRFEVEVSLPVEEELSWAEALGRPAQLAVQPATGPSERLIWRCGIISRVAALAPDRRRHNFRVDLVPQAWTLTQTCRSRIFQERSIEQIINTILDSWHVTRDSFLCRSGTSPQPRTYCVQYQESDWAFISRLLEEEGFCYAFAHGEQGEKLLISNDNAQLPMATCLEGRDDLTLEYVKPDAVEPTEEHVDQLAAAQAIRPALVVHRDQIFDKPWKLDTKKAECDRADLEVYEYLGALKPEALRETHPLTRLEQLRVESATVEGKSTSPDLVAGHRFKLRNAPSDLVATDEDTFLITEVTHKALQQPDEAASTAFQHECSFRCLLSSIPYHPPRDSEIQRPVIPGVQSAIVVGPGGEEIYTDELGRVMVQFPWDREGGFNEHSSCWVPVAQPWAGSSYGAMFIPRIGHQVVVQFIDGDPDQPIVTGAVYHQKNKPPYELPANKTRTTLKTDSSPGHGGHNEIRFEDKKGAEELHLRAQLDRTDLVNRNQTATIGKNSTVTVGNDHSETIGQDHSQVIGRNKTITVASNHTETIGGTVTYTAQGPVMETIGNSRVVTIGGSEVETVGGVRQIINGGAYVRQVGGSALLLVSGGMLTAASFVSIRGKSSVKLTCGGSTVKLTPGTIVLKNGGASISISSAEIKAVVGGSSVKINAGGVTISGPAVTSSADGANTITGGIVKVNS
jgi:type VI secretion system secreted protein VgrG